jgi:hypothetical protein
MRRWVARARIIGVAIGAVAVLAGCGAVRFGYNQGPELAYWWLDRYVDFSESQTPVVKDALSDWFAWHRRTQLPDYVQQLARLRGELKADATAIQMCRWFDDLQARSDVAFERALPGFLDVARSMSPQQVRNLQRQHAKRNDEFRDEYLQADPRERLEASVQRAVERFERIYGRLGEPQKAVIRREVQASPFDAERWAAERDARQRDLLATIRLLQTDRASGEQSLQILRALLQRNRRSANEGYRTYQERLVQYNCDFAAKVHNATTPAQRDAATKRIKGWEEDFRALAGQAAPTTADAGGAALPRLSP